MTEKSGLSRPGHIPTGLSKLDEILAGGIPENRSVLVTGGPGTGKSTLAMQFIQEGLKRGETGLFISTEQTAPELRDTFAGFDFDMDHPDLTITSIHARPGQTIESNEEQLVIETLEGEEAIGGGFSAPFSSKYISQILESYESADRIVVDSVSGLRAMSDDYNVFRRAVLDLIRLFSDEMNATSLLVAEDTEREQTKTAAALDPLQYTTHGVVQLQLNEIAGDLHRFLQVRKMRGVDHDTRPFEINFGQDGIEVIPRERTPADPHIQNLPRLSTGIPGLDVLTGGGFIEGESVVIEHDGRAAVRPLMSALGAEMMKDDEAALVFIPDASNNVEKLGEIFGHRLEDIKQLLDDDQLFVVDMMSTEASSHDNIFTVSDEDSGIHYLFELINERRGDRQICSIINTEMAVRALGEQKATEVHEWFETHLLAGENMVLYLHNPETMTDELQEYLVNQAEQSLSTWRHDTGLQYLTLEKSPTGYVGTTRLVQFTSDPPYVDIQRPAGYSNETVDGER